MRPPGQEPKAAARRSAGWVLPLLLLLAGIYAFWVLPGQLGERPVRVQFED